MAAEVGGALGSDAPAVSAEEEAAQCPFINGYCQRRHNDVVRCSWLKEKGRILKSMREVKKGEVIFREPPLHIVAEAGDNEAFLKVKELCKKYPKVFEYDALWYWTAICSLTSAQLGAAPGPISPITEDQQKKLFCLYHSEVQEPSQASKMLVMQLCLEPNTKPIDLERLLQVWILNCFEHSDDPLGYSTYFLSSFMSHSCAPNAVWHYDEDTFVLRARRDIKVGDEIAVSYLSEDALLESVPARRRHLKDSKHFMCTCDRCNTRYDLSRGFVCPRGACDGDVFYCPWGQVDGPELVGDPCEACGHKLSQEEAARYLSEEKAFDAELDRVEKTMEKAGRSKHTALLQPLEETISRAQQTMRQHWLIDKSWQLLSDLCDRNGRHEEAQGLMKKRIAWQAEAYEGLSGTRAWTLEHYADMLLRHGSATVDPIVKVPSEDAARGLLRVAPEVYRESLGILRLMFGEKHEYYTSVHRKAIELEAELKRWCGDPLPEEQ